MRAALASAERSCASSIEVSSCTIRSPACTVEPASNSIFATLPATSALTVTPCTVTNEPVALSVDSQVSALTAADVTTSGGMTMLAPAAPITENCPKPGANLTEASTASSTSRPITVRMIFLAMGRSVGGRGQDGQLAALRAFSDEGLSPAACCWTLASNRTRVLRSASES